jgi:hypothetical protein
MNSHSTRLKSQESFLTSQPSPANMIDLSGNRPITQNTKLVMVQKMLKPKYQIEIAPAYLRMVDGFFVG